MKRFLEEMKSIIEGLEGDVEKFLNKGNQSAGTRIRLQMQEIKKLANDVRADVQYKREVFKEEAKAKKEAKKSATPAA